MLFGFFYAAKRVLAVPTAPYIHRITDKISAPAFLFICGVLSSLHILAVPLLDGAYPLMATFLAGTVVGIAMGVAVSDYSNQLIKGSSRATTLSVLNLTRSIFSIGLVGIIGYFGNILPIEMTFGWIGLGTLVLVFCSCAMLARAYR